MPIVMKSAPLIETMKQEQKIVFKEAAETLGELPILNIFVNENDIASGIYVNNKIKYGEEVGVKVNCVHYEKPSDIIYHIQCHSREPFIIQEPAKISSHDVYFILNEYYENDMDGFSSHNFGDMAYKFWDSVFPCTPYGIIELLQYYNLLDEIKTVTILGRSKIVGFPLEVLLRDYFNKTVFVCHTKTSSVVKHSCVAMSDCIVSATGVQHGIFIPSGKILVDVGISRDPETNKIHGDFTQEDYSFSKAYTPVPGGVGPMTVCQLFQNTADFYVRNYPE